MPRTLGKIILFGKAYIVLRIRYFAKKNWDCNRSCYLGKEKLIPINLVDIVLHHSMNGHRYKVDCQKFVNCAYYIIKC